MTKQSYQIIIYKKSLYLSSPEPEPFFNENYGSGSSKIWRLHASRLRHTAFYIYENSPLTSNSYPTFSYIHSHVHDYSI